MENRSVVVRREIYIDVILKNDIADEILMQVVDFNSEERASCTEYNYKESYERDRRNNYEAYIPALDAFYMQWMQLVDEGVDTVVYATDVQDVFSGLFEPLRRQYNDPRIFAMAAPGKELMHDCMSMCRIANALVFDEIPYLCVGIRRRIKERYHVIADEQKREKATKLFFAVWKGEDNNAEISVVVTDNAFKKIEKITLSGRCDEEDTLQKLASILAKYHDSDIFVTQNKARIFRMFSNLMLATRISYNICSIESMLLALGRDYEDILNSEKRKGTIEDWICMYSDYIRNEEDLRYDRFVPLDVYGRFYFMIPVRFEDKNAWKKIFLRNDIWREIGSNDSAYNICASENLRGKFIVTKGKRKYELRIEEIKVQRIHSDYAIIQIAADNIIYPGKLDIIDIASFGKCLAIAKNDEPSVFDVSEKLPDSVEIKMKNNQTTYSIAVSSKDASEILWLNGLFLLGNNVKIKERYFATTKEDEMFVVIQKRPTDRLEEEKVIYKVLVDNLRLKEIEKKLADPTITVSELNDIFDEYRTIVVRNGSELYSGSKKAAYEYVNKEKHFDEIKRRLNEKFALYR